MKNSLLLILFCFFFACSQKLIQKEIPFAEQILVDTKNAESLKNDFEKQVPILRNSKIEKYLQSIVQRLVKQEAAYPLGSIQVRVFEDGKKEFTRFFAFPGTTLFVPKSFLNEVRFENELAAALSFEVAGIFKRTLANHVEKLKPEEWFMFGEKSVFRLEDAEKTALIHEGMRLLYFGGFDTRGMSSMFQQYPEYYVDSESSDLFKKEVSFLVREAQRTKSEFMPSLKPVVRSDEFIQFKKDLK